MDEAEEFVFVKKLQPYNLGLNGFVFIKVILSTFAEIIYLN